MSKIIKFGEDVEGYSIPVLNEREIRAAAGILFLVMFISISAAITKGELLLMKYSIMIFLADIIIRVFINPKYSPMLIIGRFIVRNQVPEYTGAKQKKFAWIIGTVMVSAVFVHIVVLNAYSPVSGILCFTCLIFLFFESAFGICLGCKFYSLFNKNNIQYCPGDICSSKTRHDIQKISGSQALFFIIFIAFFILSVFLFNKSFNNKPHYLFGTQYKNNQYITCINNVTYYDV